MNKLVAALAGALGLLMAPSAQAQFDWDSGCSGSGSFAQSLTKDAISVIGSIPAGKTGVDIRLTAATDIDIQLIDTGTNPEYQIVAWPSGELNGWSKQTTVYQGTNVEYSGYNGDGTGFGNEYIKMSNTTTRALQMRAFAFASGSATVNYSWEGTLGCVEEGEGTFSQDILDKQTSIVGDIPAGLSDIYIGLVSSKDVDVQLINADTGEEVVVWPSGLLNGSSEQSVNYNGVTVTWSGFNGDGTNFGHEFIQIKGTTTNRFTMRAFGYAAGAARVNYSWGKFAIYAGIFGGGPSDLSDDTDPVARFIGAKQIMQLMTSQGANCSGCDPNSDFLLRQVAAREVGGMTSIAYSVVNTVYSRTSLNGPSNTTQIANDMVNYVGMFPRSNVYTIGHSVGGGDVQSLVYRLKDLGIAVELSSQIDSVEIGWPDDTISTNVERHMNFYQTQGAALIRGEDNVTADNAAVTTVTNTRIHNATSDPGPGWLAGQTLGPSNIEDNCLPISLDTCAYHRNIDNDRRVWNTFLTSMRATR